MGWVVGYWHQANRAECDHLSFRTLRAQPWHHTCAFLPMALILVPSTGVCYPGQAFRKGPICPVKTDPAHLGPFRCSGFHAPSESSYPRCPGVAAGSAHCAVPAPHGADAAADPAATRNSGSALPALGAAELMSV